MDLNDVTFVLWMAFWPIWLLWEITLLILRGEQVNVGLISMVAKDRAYQLNAVPYFWMGLGAHFFGNWFHTRVWSTPIPGVIFWALGVGILVCDIFLWHTAYTALPYWARLLRYPGLVALVGLLSGYLLFPQRGITP